MPHRAEKEKKERKKVNKRKKYFRPPVFVKEKISELKLSRLLQKFKSFFGSVKAILLQVFK